MLSRTFRLPTLLGLRVAAVAARIRVRRLTGHRHLGAVVAAVLLIPVRLEVAKAAAALVVATLGAVLAVLVALETLVA
jgi:hypothetical protein